MKWNTISALSLILGLSTGIVAKASTEPTPPATTITGSGSVSGTGTVTGNGTITNNGDGTETITGTVTVIGTVTVKISDLKGPDSEGPVTLDSEEQTFVGLLNALRKEHGAPPLKVSDKLNQISQWMSSDMANKNYFNHTDSSGKSPFNRMTDVGYHSEYEGENIAEANTGDAQDIYLQWFNSPGHFQNMIDPHFTEIGVGRATNAEDQWYWTTDFGSN
jgi:uncharacterized protein YkwD